MRSWHASNPCGRRFEEELFSSDPNRFSPLEYTLNAVYVSKTSSCQRSHKHHGIQFRFYHHTKNSVANCLQSCLYYFSLSSFLTLFLLHNAAKAFPFLPNAVWNSPDEIRWYCCQCVTGAIPGIFRSPGLRPNGVLECFLSYRFNMQKKNKNVTFVNYPHLKKQSSEEDSLKIQASSPQALFFPAYPGDILCHVCKRDPVARQATPVFHR